jgi:bifunctional DNA-binding transcriptional regulator/antitoxin component of YhaV-PrlF toxin-antitoxin module
MFDYSLRVGEGGTIRLPDDVLQHHNLRPGDRLELVERPDGVLEMRPVLQDDMELGWFLEDDFSSDEIHAERNDDFAAKNPK